MGMQVSLPANEKQQRAEVEVGHYRIDLVIDGENDSLAIECDGERWHTLDNLAEDAARHQTGQARVSSVAFQIEGSPGYRR